MKYDISDCTFTIPCKIDSEDRKKNLILVMNYLQKVLKTNIIIGEYDTDSKIKNFWNSAWDEFARHIFIKNPGQYFHKTLVLNTMAKESKTPYIVSYDSDILFLPEQYMKARNALHMNLYDFCYPFDQALRNIPKEQYDTLANTLDLNTIQDKVQILHPAPPPGGCFFMKKDKFMEAGLENEAFISWGPEDVERLHRVQVLGYKVGALPGPIFHMDHTRTPHSTHEHDKFKKNEAEFNKIKSMSAMQLRHYVNTWRWKK